MTHRIQPLVPMDLLSGRRPLHRFPTTDEEDEARYRAYDPFALTAPCAVCGSTRGMWNALRGVMVCRRGGHPV